MTNETPENPQPTPPAQDGGQHTFGPVASSAPVESAPPAPPAPQQYPGVPSAGPQAGYPGAPGAYPAAYDPSMPAHTPNAPGGVPPYGGPAFPPPSDNARKGLSKGALFGIIGGAGALVLIIAAAIIVPAVLRGPAVTASDVVEDYLTALSEGDAEAAQEFVEPYDETLLSDEVLEASLELGAIDDIEVGESSEGEYSDSVVPVTFTIGGASVARDFTVYETGDEWIISDGLIPLSSLGTFEGLEPTVNGAEAPLETAYVFPGTYELALGLEQFAIEGDATTFVVASDSDAEALWDLRPALTDAGAETFRSLVRASLEECVALKTLATPCGMDLTDIDLSGATPIDGTVTRTITTEGQSTLSSLTAEVSSGTVVTTYDSVDIDMTLEGDEGGTRSQFEVWFGGYLGTPKVDFAAETPTVVWE